MSAEVALMVAFIVTGLVAMAVYGQRAMQGSIRGTTQSLGLQFDKNDHYKEEQFLGQDQDDPMREFTLEAEVTRVISMRDAPIVQSASVSSSSVGGVKVPHQKWVLESLPEGPVPREPVFSTSGSQREWNTRGKTTYGYVDDE